MQEHHRILVHIFSKAILGQVTQGMEAGVGVLGDDALLLIRSVFGQLGQLFFGQVIGEGHRSAFSSLAKVSWALLRTGWY